MSAPWNIDVRYYHGGNFEMSDTIMGVNLEDNWTREGSVRRSPRLASTGNLRTPTLSPVARVEKLQVRRKVSAVFDKEDSPVVVEEGNDEGDLEPFIDEEGNDEGDKEYWSEDSNFSQFDVGDTEVVGDLVEEEELFNNGPDENLIDDVNKNLNHSCLRAGKSKLFNVDDLDVRIGEEVDLNSDEDRSVAGSGDAGDSNDIFDPSVDFKKPIVLKKGLKFPSVEVYRTAVRQHAIENGYEPYFCHNDSARVTIYCRDRCDCPWNAKRSRLPRCTCKAKRKCEFRLYATKLDDDLTFQIKSLNLEHVCAYTTKNRMVTSEYLAEKYLETWRNDPHWSLKGVQGRVKLDLGVDVGYHKCWVARARAKMMIHGKCGTLGDNKKSCKNTTPAPKQKSKGGRPQKDTSWVRAAKTRAQQKSATRAHDQEILSQIGSQAPTV